MDLGCNSTEWVGIGAENLSREDFYYRVSQKLSEHMFLREYRHCGVAVGAAVFQTVLKFTSRVIDECCIVPRSGRDLVPLPVRLALG